MRKSFNNKRSDETVNTIVEQVVEELKPVFKEMLEAERLFDEIPSIKNGSSMQRCQETAKNALLNATNYLWEVYEGEYREALTREEFGSLIEDAFQRLIETRIGNEQYWIRFIGRNVK